MPRYSVPFTQKQLKEKIESHYEDEEECCFQNITPTVEEDLSKVEFCSENQTIEPGDFSCGADDEVVGYHTLDNGFTFLGVLAGGDWETPVFFIIYWDGKKLRGYIPSDGNTYHKGVKKAFGNEGTHDKTRNCEVCNNAVEQICMFCDCCDKCCKCGEDKEMQDVEELSDNHDQKINHYKLIEDIKGRIIMR